MSQSVRVLLMVVAILVGVIVGVAAGILAVVDGASLATAVLRGSGAFGAASVLVLTLIIFVVGPWK